MLLRCELNQYFLKEVYMKKTITLSLVFFFIGIQTIMALSPLFLEEIEKDGPCPPGWNSYGSYCVAGNSAKPIIPKSGSCPSGWNSHGGWCVKN